MPAGLAIPAVAGAVGSYFAQRSVKGSTDPSPQETAASAGQSGAAGSLLRNSATLGGIGTSALGRSAGYFSSLAGGNRATMTQALAPDIESINKVYGGTARTLARFTRGPNQNVQMAEAERQRAGQIGDLFGTARAGANASLAGIGTSALSGSTAAAGGAGSIFGTQASQGQASRFGGAGLELQAGQNFGGLLYNLLKNYSGKGNNSSAPASSGSFGGFPTSLGDTA